MKMTSRTQANKAQPGTRPKLKLPQRDRTKAMPQAHHPDCSMGTS